MWVRTSRHPVPSNARCRSAIVTRAWPATLMARTNATYDRMSVAPLCTRVRLPIHLDEVCGVDVGVALRGGELHVPEQLLDRAQVCPALQQVRRERVPQRVRTDAEACAARGDVARHQSLHAASAEARAARVDEE